MDASAVDCCCMWCPPPPQPRPSTGTCVDTINQPLTPLKEFFSEYEGRLDELCSKCKQMKQIYNKLLVRRHFYFFFLRPADAHSTDEGVERLSTLWPSRWHEVEILRAVVVKVERKTWLTCSCAVQSLRLFLNHLAFCLIDINTGRTNNRYGDSAVPCPWLGEVPAFCRLGFSTYFLQPRFRRRCVSENRRPLTRRSWWAPSALSWASSRTRCTVNVTRLAPKNGPCELNALPPPCLPHAPSPYPPPPPPPPHLNFTTSSKFSNDFQSKRGGRIGRLLGMSEVNQGKISFSPADEPSSFQGQSHHWTIFRVLSVTFVSPNNRFVAVDFLSWKRHKFFIGHQPRFLFHLVGCCVSGISPQASRQRAK